MDYFMSYNVSHTGNATVDYYDKSFDYYNIYYEGDISNLKSAWVREPHFVPLITVYTCVFLCGVVGNGLVLFAIVGSKKTRNVTFSFMLSLAAADLLFVLVCVPIDTLGMLLGHWEGGRIFCKLSGYASMLSAMASILNLTTISVERYIVIVKPLKSRKYCSTGRTRGVLVMVWIAASMLSVPAALIRDVSVTTFYNNKTTVQTSLCGEHSNDANLLLFSVYQLVVMFILPTLIMAYCYTIVIYALWLSRNTLLNMTPKCNRSLSRSLDQMTDYSTRRPSQTCSDRWTARQYPQATTDKARRWAAKDNRTNALKARKQIVKMLVTIVIIFQLCWGPKIILQLLKGMRLEVVYYPSVFHAQIGIYCLSYIQSCVNPCVYGLMCKNFRISLQFACRRLRVPCCTKQPSVLTNGSLDLGDSRNSMESFKLNKNNTSTTNWQTFSVGCERYSTVLCTYRKNGSAV